jgi:hypothetical protein
MNDYKEVIATKSQNDIKNICEIWCFSVLVAKIS